MGQVPSRTVSKESFFVDIETSKSRERIALVPLCEDSFPSDDGDLFRQFYEARCDPNVRLWYCAPSDVPRDKLPTPKDCDLIYKKFVKEPQEIFNLGLCKEEVLTPMPVMVVKMHDLTAPLKIRSTNCTAVGYFGCRGFSPNAKIDDTHIIGIFLNKQFYNEAKADTILQIACKCYQHHCEKVFGIPPSRTPWPKRIQFDTLDTNLPCLRLMQKVFRVVTSGESTSTAVSESSKNVEGKEEAPSFLERDLLRKQLSVKQVNGAHGGGADRVYIEAGPDLIKAVCESLAAKVKCRAATLSKDGESNVDGIVSSRKNKMEGEGEDESSGGREEVKMENEAAPIHEGLIIERGEKLLGAQGEEKADQEKSVQHRKHHQRSSKMTPPQASSDGGELAPFFVRVEAPAVISTCASSQRSTATQAQEVSATTTTIGQDHQEIPDEDKKEKERNLSAPVTATTTTTNTAVPVVIASTATPFDDYVEFAKPKWKEHNAPADAIRLEVRSKKLKKKKELPGTTSADHQRPHPQQQQGNHNQSSPHDGSGFAFQSSSSMTMNMSSTTTGTTSGNSSETRLTPPPSVVVGTVVGYPSPTGLGQSTGSSNSSPTHVPNNHRASSSSTMMMSTASPTMTALSNAFLFYPASDQLVWLYNYPTRDWIPWSWVDGAIALTRCPQQHFPGQSIGFLAAATTTTASSAMQNSPSASSPPSFVLPSTNVVGVGTIPSPPSIPLKARVEMAGFFALPGLMTTVGQLTMIPTNHPTFGLTFFYFEVGEILRYFDLANGTSGTAYVC